jgi:hypothetical protein
MYINQTFLVQAHGDPVHGTSAKDDPMDVFFLLGKWIGFYHERSGNTMAFTMKKHGENHGEPWEN